VTADDVADALVRIALHEEDDLHGRALNLCGRPALSAREVVEQLRLATGRDLHFHPRPLWLSQVLEIGKWMVKKAGRRPGVTFPSYRDLKARSFAATFSSRTAREVLGWTPVEDREGLLDRTVRIYGDDADRTRPGGGPA
jgi:nucleoside-diphosphate-sugar epimerase